MQLFGSAFELDMPHPRLHIVADKKNPKALAIAKKFSHLSSGQPNMVLVCGGDGFMLDSLHKFWNMRLPFFGVNAGHKGFLLNDAQELSDGIPRKIKIYDLPLLEVEVVLVGGKIKRMLAFNDVWVEKINRGQAAWIEIKVNGVIRLPKLVADAALISTPTGSTAYARSMGAWPVPLDAQVLVLAGSSVFDPFEFKPCYLPIWSKIELRTIDLKKRPLFGIVDGIHLGKVEKIEASVSRTASIQLANVGDYGLPEKLLGIQFPQCK
jgi:NAD kinase